jgi:hypothetical protein
MAVFAMEMYRFCRKHRFHFITPGTFDGKKTVFMLINLNIEPQHITDGLTHAILMFTSPEYEPTSKLHILEHPDKEKGYIMNQLTHVHI